MHANAAGLSVHESQLSNLLNYANSHISDEGLLNVYYVDYIFQEDESFQNILLKVADHPELWGNNIEEPTVVVEKIPFYEGDWFIMGENKDSAKLSHNGVEYVKFKNPDFVQEVRACARGTITVYGKIKKNTWMGRTTPQILIDDYEIVDTTFDF